MGFEDPCAENVRIPDPLKNRRKETKRGRNSHKEAATSLKACFKERPVRGPGLQDRRVSARFCRPRAPTRGLPDV